MQREVIHIIQSIINRGDKNSVFELAFSEELINVNKDKKDIIEMARNIIPFISSLEAKPGCLISC